MNEQLGEAVLKLALDGSGFKVGANGVSGSLNDIIKKTGQAALGFTGGLGLYNAIEKVRMSLINNVADFRAYEKSLKEVSTLVDTTVVDMGALELGIDKVSKKWARGKDSLTSALYETISANVAAGDSIAFLDKAVEASVAGVTDSKVAVDGLTSVMNAYGLTINEITDVSDAFFVGVRDGKTKFEDLANGIGKVVPIASQVGMSYNDLIAITASLTMSGLRTEEAFTGVRTVLSAILKPSEDAKETAKLLGIEFDVNTLKAKGFAKFMDEIKEKTGGSQIALAKLFPDVQGLNAAMSITSEQGGKNLNKVLSDMEKRMGETQIAANKMKDSLDFDMEKLGNNFKNLGLNIIGGLSPAIQYITQSFNGLFDIGKIKTLQGQFTTDRSAMSTEDLQRFVAYNKALIEETTALASKNEQMGAIDQGRLERAKNYIKVAQEEIELRKIESGEANKALSYQKYLQDEKDKGAKKDEENAKKAQEAKQKEIDALIKNEEARKKNQEIAQKNAELLNKLESDRLAVSERVAGIESDRNSQIIDDRRKAIEATAQYNKLAYDQQENNLQKIVDDEKRSTEERLQANQKLYTLKIDAAESAKNSELEALKLATEAEQLEQEKRIVAIQNYAKEVDNQYKDSIDKVKNSDLKNKSDVISRLETERAASKKSFEYMIDNAGQAFSQIETRGEIAAANINQKFKNELGTTITAKIGADIQIDDQGFEQIRDGMVGIKQTFFDIAEAYKELENVGDNATYTQVKTQVNKINQLMISAVNTLQSTFSDFSGKYLTAILQDTRVAVSGVVSDVSDLVSNIGEETGNIYLKVAGSVGKFFGNILNMAEKDEAKHEAYYKKQIALIDQLSKGFDTTIEKTKDWLEQIGKVDTSNKSLSELKDTLQSIYKQGALAVSSSTGMNMTPEEFAMYSQMANKKGSGVAQYVIDKGGTYEEYVQKVKEHNAVSGGESSGYGYNTFTKEEFALETRRVNEAKKQGKAFDLTGAYGQITARQYYDQIESTQRQINNYDQQAGLDYTLSKSKDDFLADINTMRDVGMISELQYYRDLYEYASGIKSHPYNAWEWFGVEDVKRYKKQYEDYLNYNQGSSGIIGLAKGGIAMSPTYAQIAEAGTPEAVIPLDKLGSIMNSMYGGMGTGTINVNLTVDPNIPITRDSAATLSEEFGQRIETVFRSRGI